MLGAPHEAARALDPRRPAPRRVFRPARVALAGAAVDRAPLPPAARAADAGGAAPLAVERAARAPARGGAPGADRAGGAAGAGAVQSGPARELLGDRHALRGPADHPARRGGAAPHRGRRGRLHHGGRREVRDGSGGFHHHPADALARPRPRGPRAGDLAGRPRYSIGAQHGGELGLGHEARVRPDDRDRLLPGRAHRGRSGAAPVALRGDRLPAGALALAHRARGARGHGRDRPPARPGGAAPREPAHRRSDAGLAGRRRLRGAAVALDHAPQPLGPGPRLPLPSQRRARYPRAWPFPRGYGTGSRRMSSRYESLMDVVRSRMTNRAFAPAAIPRAHVEMILEAARHAPSGANAQPWHFIVVTDEAAKAAIGQCFVDEQQHRAKLRMGFPTPNYHGVKTAPGLIVIAADFRFVRAFPVLNDGSALDRLYHQNAERILLKSVAAATMSAHLAAAALGYAVWWITAIGQDDIQQQVKPLGEVDRVRVTTVVDNYIDALRQDEKVARRHNAFVARQMVDLRAEHGLAHYVEVTRGAETVRIAFDFGPSEAAITHNFRVLGLDAGAIDALALSH